jgi:hypothetical protein
MPQILHPQQQKDLCTQTYPQKMGIDNSHAVISDQRARFGFFFGTGSRNAGLGFGRNSDAGEKKGVGGGRTYRE